MRLVARKKIDNALRDFTAFRANGFVFDVSVVVFVVLPVPSDEIQADISEVKNPRRKRRGINDNGQAD